MGVVAATKGSPRLAEYFRTCHPSPIQGSEWRSRKAEDLAGGRAMRHASVRARRQAKKISVEGVRGVGSPKGQVGVREQLTSPRPDSIALSLFFQEVLLEPVNEK